MKKRRLCFPLILLLTFFSMSCAQKTSEESNSVEVNSEDFKPINLSKYVSDYSFIKLETNANSIIGEVSKIEIHEDIIYILDFMTNTLFRFNPDGTYLNKINKVGVGPEEYIRLTDFYVNKNGVYLLDFSGKSILKLTHNLEFIEKQAITSMSTHLVVDSAGLFTLYNERINTTNDYAIVQKKGEDEKEYFLRSPLENTINNWSLSNTLQVNQNNVFFSDKYANTIFQFTNGQWDKFIEISFANKNLPKNEHVNRFENIYDLSFPYIVRNNYYVSDSLLIVDFFFNQKRFYLFYNLIDQTKECGEVYNDVIDKDYKRFALLGKSQQFLVETIFAEDVINDFSILKKYDQSLINIKAEDNPIIILYKLTQNVTK